MYQIHSSEALISSVSREIFLSLWNPSFCYHVHSSMSIVRPQPGESSPRYPTQLF